MMEVLENLLINSFGSLGCFFTLGGLFYSECFVAVIDNSRLHHSILKKSCKLFNGLLEVSQCSVELTQR